VLKPTEIYDDPKSKRSVNREESPNLTRKEANGGKKEARLFGRRATGGGIGKEKKNPKSTPTIFESNGNCRNHLNKDHTDGDSQKKKRGKKDQLRMGFLKEKESPHGVRRGSGKVELEYG